MNLASESVVESVEDGEELWSINFDWLCAMKTYLSGLTPTPNNCFGNFRLRMGKTSTLILRFRLNENAWLFTHRITNFIRCHGCRTIFHSVREIVSSLNYPLKSHSIERAWNKSRSEDLVSSWYQVSRWENYCWNIGVEIASNPISMEIKYYFVHNEQKPQKAKTCVVEWKPKSLRKENAINGLSFSPSLPVVLRIEMKFQLWTFNIDWLLCRLFFRVPGSAQKLLCNTLSKNFIEQWKIARFSVFKRAFA